MDDIFEIHAIKYAHLSQRSPSNFIGGDAHNIDMPLDYFVWVVRNQDFTLVVDTGFDETMARHRGRSLYRPVGEGLRALGIDPATVKDVAVTHLHYDHAGNNDLFPAARFHLQEKEMEFATGRCMCHAAMSHGYSVNDVVSMVRRVYDGNVCFCNGYKELRPGIELHHLGGHTKGLQVVRVKTRRGWTVLASDASHFYANIMRCQSFPIVYNMGDMLDGFETIKKLASSENMIIPGHDPEVLRRFPRSLEGTERWIVRVDEPPIE
jgi:glyoxylase-like metal-dependent hydrolase (beta-lactamase superfamily II)